MKSNKIKLLMMLVIGLSGASAFADNNLDLGDHWETIHELQEHYDLLVQRLNTYNSNLANQLASKKGDKGNTGAQGIQGLQGDVGPVGPSPQGDKGPTGPKGATGPQGDKGASHGPVGPQGDTGPVGNKGIVGLPGIAGAAGPQGPQGIQGIQGNTGPQGDAGRDGANIEAIPFRSCSCADDQYSGVQLSIRIQFSNGRVATDNKSFFSYSEYAGVAADAYRACLASVATMCK